MGQAERTPGLVVLCDRLGRIREVLHDGLGLAGRAAPGRALTALVDEDSAAKMLSFLARLLRDQAVFDWELNVPLGDALAPLHFMGTVTPDGPLVIAARSCDDIVRLSEELVQTNNEQANALRATAKELALVERERGARNDVVFDELSRLNNELATLHRELARQNQELERLNALKNQFLGMAAHDLRSPLGVIMAYSEFLEGDAAPLLPDEQMEFIRTIRSSSAFMLDLIDNLLDVTQIEAGRLALEVRPTDLAALVRHNVALNRVLAQKKQITLDLHVDDDLPLVPLDAHKVDQVLNNLISNACKFSPAGRSEAPTAVEVEVRQEADGALLVVRDHGPGIPAQEMERLFRPFGKTSVRATSGERSTGLGLMIVRRIVEGHGGRVWVESRVGEGSTFHVRLPFAAQGA